MSLTMTPTTAAAMASVRRDKAGVGSAVLNSMRQVGGSLGIADHGRDRRRRDDCGLSSGDARPVAFTHGLHNALLGRAR